MRCFVSVFHQYYPALVVYGVLKIELQLQSKTESTPVVGVWVKVKSTVSMALINIFKILPIVRELFISKRTVHQIFRLVLEEGLDGV